MKHPLKRWLPFLLLILVGVAAYWNSFDGVFLYDDVHSIRDNPHICRLWPLSESMSLPLWSTGMTVDGRPLLSLSFALNHALLGPEPRGYHLVNLLIHIAAGLLLFGVVRRTLDLPQFRERYEGSGCWIAMATAAIWLVHPLQTESVTYIVQRAESLMGLLFLLTMYCAIRGLRGEKSGRWYAATVLACACGMGVKQTMFSAPLLVILYDYIFTDGLALPAKAGQAASLPRSAGRGLQDPLSVARARLPSVASEARRMGRARGRFYAALCSTWLIVFAIIVATWQESTSDFVSISPLRYLLTQPLVLLQYLRLAVWPSPLVLSYGWTLEDQWPRIVFPALAILGMLAVMFRGIVRRKWYGFVLAWFFLILAPTSSIAPMRQAIFEHRMYLSLAAAVMLAVLGAEYAVRKFATDPKRRAAVGGCLALASVIVLGYRTHDRNRDYHSQLRIWQDNVTHRPESHVAHNNLGHALQALGRSREAAEHCREALRIDPMDADAHNNLGNALQALGDLREAMQHYREAVRLNPRHAEALYNYGVALEAGGQPGDALSHYRKAVRIDPDLVDARYNLGNRLLALGQPQEAIEQYRQVLLREPDYAGAHKNWGVALLYLGRNDEAIVHGLQAVRINPADASAHNNLGAIYQESGRLPDAIRHFEEALRLKPEYSVARENLRETRRMKDEG